MSGSNLAWEKADAEGVWIGESPTPGPTVAIIGGVHGDEMTGIEVVKGSFERIAIDCGRVILMVANWEARNIYRQIFENLNRNFRQLTEAERYTDPERLPYEIRRAQELLPYLDASVASLDLHDFTNPGKPFIICERNALTTARAIGAPIISFGWSQTEPGGTDGYMFEQGKEGICYELGQKHCYRENLEQGHGAVARFLIAQGLIEGNLTPLFTDPMLVQTQAAFRRTSLYFDWADDFSNFQPLEAGKLIATHDGKELRAKAGDVIIFPMKVPPVNTEAFTLGRIVTA